MKPVSDDFDELASPQTLAWALAGVSIGAVLALWALPSLAPAVAASLTAPQPKTWWYLSRASGLVSYALLAISMLLGLLLSTRFAKEWPGNATAFALHEHASILGLAFALFHAIVLLGDRHTPFALLDIVVPFGAAYRPLAVGLGQLAAYAMALLIASFYVRKRLGQRAWRLLHFASFAVFVLASLHAALAGTDGTVLATSLVPIAIVLFFATYRVLAGLIGEHARA